MFILFGSAPKITDVGSVVLACQQCGRRAPQHGFKKQQRLSLFFIPVLTLSTSYQVTCGACGTTTRLSRDEAARVGLA